MIEATGVGALKDFAERCARHQTQLILVDLQPLTRQTLETMGVLPRDGTTLVATFDEARALAQRFVGRTDAA